MNASLFVLTVFGCIASSEKGATVKLVTDDSTNTDNAEVENTNTDDETLEDDVETDPNPCEPELEICDGIDNDCDGLIDDEDDDIDVESMIQFYEDLDGDGFGGQEIWSCELQDVMVENNEDCNDEDENIHPQATETCDGIDNDCDQNIDSEEICPCDFFSSEDSSYFFCSETISWTDAQTTCTDYGYHLVSISSLEELLFVGENLTYMTSVWIGLHNINEEGTWEWSNQEEVSYTNWNAFEPSNDEDKNCTYIDPNGGWSTSYCDYWSAYVCEVQH